MTVEKDLSELVQALIKEPFLNVLAERGMEPDQFIATALESLGDPVYAYHQRFSDGQLFHALWRLNAVSTRYLHITPPDTQIPELGVPFFEFPRSAELKSRSSGLRASSLITADIIARTVVNARDKRTFGTRDFLRTILELPSSHPDLYKERPHTIDLLCLSAGYSKDTPASNVPGLMELLHKLREEYHGVEDFDYTLMLKNGRIAFRVVSVWTIMFKGAIPACGCRNGHC